VSYPRFIYPPLPTI